MSCPPYLDGFKDGRLVAAQSLFLAYGFPTEICNSYKNSPQNRKVMVHSTNGDAAFFDAGAEVLQNDKLAPYLIIIWLWTSTDLMKENGPTQKKD